MGRAWSLTPAHQITTKLVEINSRPVYEIQSLSARGIFIDLVVQYGAHAADRIVLTGNV